MGQSKQDPAAKTPSLEESLARRGIYCLCVLVGIFVAAYTLACLTKYDYYLYWDIDLAHHVQECHNILHGSLQNTLLGTNFLGNHFALIMFPVAGIYAVFASPMTLVVLQVLAAASAAFPLYFMFRRLLNAPVALALVVAYLAHPALGYTLLYEFHPVVFGAAFLMWAFWAFPFGGSSGRFWTFVVFSVLALCSQENISLILIMVGLFGLIFVRKSRVRWGVAPLVMGLVWFVLVMVIIMPRLNEGKVGFYNIYKAEWGSSLSEIAGNVITRPAKAVEFLYSTPGASPGANADSANKKAFYFYVFLPVLFVSILSPATLALMLPILLQQMLSARHQEHSILWHYSALLLPIVMLSVAMGLRNLLGWLGPPESRARIASRVCAAALVVSVALCHLTYGPFGPESLSVMPASRGFKALPDPTSQLSRKHWDEMVSQVPAGVPVVSTFVFQPRLADRARIYSYHHLVSGHYTLSEEPFPLPEGIDAALIDFADPFLLGSWGDIDAGPRMREFFARERLVPVRMMASTVLFLRNPAPDQKIEPLYEVQNQLPDFIGVIDRDFRGPDLDGPNSRELVRLVSAELPVRMVAPGGLLPMKLYWRSSSNQKHWLDFQIHLGCRGDQAVRSIPVLVPLGYNLYLPFEWPRQKVIMQNAEIPLPEDLPEGPAEVFLTVMVLRGGRAMPLSTMTESGEQQPIVVRLGTITIRKAAAQP